MNRLFGKGKDKAPPPDLGACISNVDKRAEDMDKKAAQCEGELRKIREQMKKMRDGPAKNALKQKALRILQRKKMFDNQSDSFRSQSFNMEQATMALQTAKDTQVVVAGMKAGVKEMKKEFKKIDVDKIEDLQDELADVLEISEDVQEALGRSYNIPDVDEDELEAELDALGDEIALDDDTSYLDEAVHAPNAPDKEPSRPGAVRNTDGVPVDEFGLPQVPAT
ncbi:charged multivesicular body protein 5 [Folsomia candida]|uniref:charged multivesicular body protein 5 n=1 Tax=Folsomia candida TaxID=158441 RepID=UPI000B90389A|nr:charged multivesicular body protein 5 [Folsomia candida]